MVCKMTFNWLDRDKKIIHMTQGTGFFIDSQCVLTARHNFYQKKNQNKCSNCQIEIKSIEGNILRYETSSPDHWYEEEEYDLGMVTFLKPVQGIDSKF